MTIKPESFTVTVDEFASKRRDRLEQFDNALYSHVADSLKRVGLRSWENPLVEMASKLFKELALEESDEWTQVMSDLRDDFERELRDTLQKAKPVGADQFLAQVERTTRWMSTMIVNAATEAATTADPDENVGLEWVTMEDGNVRDSHKAAHGQQVPTGQKFEVGGVELLYPGEPVGPPENWINCRCVVRPAMLSSLTAAADAPGLKKDGTPPKCKYCENPATQYVLHSEGMAYVPACDDHIEQAKSDAAKSVPSGEPDPSNIDRVGKYITAAGVKEEVVDPDVEEEVDDEAQMIPDDAADLEVPWHGVLAPEGVPSGDGRMFAPDALTWRDLPLTLKAMFVDDEGHKGSVVAGRIDKIWREDGLIKAEGVFDHSAGGYESIRMLAEGVWRGVSVDVDQAELAVEEYSEDGSRNLTFAKARISAATQCVMPAFAEAYISLGPWPVEEKEVPDVRDKDEDEQIAGIGMLGEVDAAGEGEQFKPVPPQTKDGPGWITHPDPTEDITNYWVDGRGAAKIRWGAGGDFNRCRRQLAKYVQNPDWLAGLCANLHYRALGIWPGEHKASGRTEQMAGRADESAELPSVTLVASADTKTKISADFFRNPMLEEPTALQVDPDSGHVYGHVATWDTCHIGKVPCTTAPHSALDYAYFLHGEVDTDAGPVPVGQITLGTGHADPNLGIIGALAHYDNTGTAVADVYAGEDDHGIWVAGRLREGVTEKQIRDLKASAVSGDWRGVVVGGQENLEMCAVLAVNVPGFPIPRVRVVMSGERQVSLIAAGALEPSEIDHNDPERIARIEKLQATARSFRAERIKASIRAARGGN